MADALSERSGGPRTPARRRLLSAAEDLFYREGIAGTGVDAVLARAGVAIGSLYRNFKGKDGLAVAYLEDRQARWLLTWEAAVAEAATPKDRVLAVFDALASWSAGEGCARGCADLAALVSLPPDHPAAVAAARHKGELWARLRTLVAAAVPPDAVEAVTGEVMLAHDGALARLAVTGGADAGPVGAARSMARRSLEAARRHR